MFRKMPFILLAVILLAALLNNILPLSCKEAIYSLSLTIKSAILFVLPALIFMLLFKALSQLAGKATKIVLLILGAVCVSNFFSTLISYQIGTIIYQFDLSLAHPKGSAELHPAWTLLLPKWIGNDHAMFAGLLFGLLFSLFSPLKAERLASFFEKIVQKMLQAILACIPVFIAGFVIKLVHEKVLQHILRDYAFVFILVALAQFGYILLVYLLANGFRLAPFLASLKNMLPAALAGFGSMSSAAAMPLTILGAEKNTQNSALSRLAVPATVNVHLIGDCFAIPIFAFAVLKNYGALEPAFTSYLLFALYFVLAKFSVAAIPGGGILVMLPILEAHLGFSGEMSSLITALYILFDPVITCANVSGNGGFVLVLSRLQGLFRKKSRAG